MIKTVLNAKTELKPVEIPNILDFGWGKEYILESSLGFFSKIKQFSNTWTHGLHFCSVCYYTGIAFQFGENKGNSSWKDYCWQAQGHKPVILSLVQQPAWHISNAIGSWSALKHLIKAIILGFNGFFLLLQYQETLLKLGLYPLQTVSKREYFPFQAFSINKTQRNQPGEEMSYLWV